jgi:DNA-binding NarL/FixJ family response regulator
LIVEDDRALAGALKRVFLQYGPTTLATSVAEGRAALTRSEPLAGIVIDVGLPDGSGLDLLGEVRAERPHLPALVLTSSNAPASINQSYALRASYLCKPGTTQDLVDFILRALTAQATPAQRIELVIEEITRERRLVPTEVRLLVATCRGVQRASLAAELGVVENTLKTRIKTLLRKCEASNLTDLTHLVLRRALGM